MQTRTLCLASLVAAAAAGGLLFAGTGGCDIADIHCGCDAADVNCVDPQPELRSYSLTTDPMALESLDTYDVDGSPSWTKVVDECLLVTVTDKHNLLSYQIEPTSQLSLKSNISVSPGVHPVHIDAQNGFVLVANYRGPDHHDEDDGASGVSSFKILDGCLLEKLHYMPARGRSVNPGHQSASHIHSVNFWPGHENVFFACDLGADAIITATVTEATGEIVPSSQVSCTAGSGPRHMAFHPSLEIAYVLMEMGNYVVVYSISEEGELTEISRATTVFSLPGLSSLSEQAVFSGYSKAAEVLITSDGEQLIVSNRGFGPDSGGVVVYNIDEDGILHSHVSSSVVDAFPRGVALIEGGDFEAAPVIIVAGQSDSKLSIFTVESDNSLQTIHHTIVDGPPHPTTVSYANRGHTSAWKSEL